jgi:cleavage and polyadenylation specificity factor subunit 1
LTLFAVQKPKWGLQVCDSLSSASPIGDITICRSLDEADRENAEESALDHRLIGKPKKLLEIVACSGQNKSGALTVIQNGIRPVVVTSLELPSCQAMWALYSREADNSFSADPETGRELHQYLFLSRADSTMVLQTGEALEEVTDMDFPADQATINVGNVLSNTRIVHVYEKGIFLLNGSTFNVTFVFVYALN